MSKHKRVYRPSKRELKEYENPVITAGEVARMLGITRQAVYLRSVKGTLPMVGKSVEGIALFSRVEIERIRDARSAGAKTETSEETPAKNN